MRKGALLLALLAPWACSTGSKVLSARFDGPTALAPFAGYTSKRPGVLHRYLAVASSRGNEIRLLDPEDGQTVMSPGLVFPLSVPTFQPTRLASAALGDGLADVLVATGPGSSTVAVVGTWDVGRTAVNDALSVDLAQPPISTRAAIVSLAAMTTPASASGGAPQARVLVGLSDGTLAVLEYGRDAATGGLQLLRAAGQSLGFEALDIAVEPGGSRLFIATRDALLDRTAAVVHGVAQVDASGDAASPWPVVGLDARGPTRLVTAGLFAERTPASSRAYGPPQLDVLAVLDESSCGTSQAIECGLVTLVPDQGNGGIPPDPAGELAFRAPIRLAQLGLPANVPPVPAYPVALATVMPRHPPPPALPGDDPDPLLWDVVPDRTQVPILNLYRSIGPVQASALVVVAAADGFVHLVDPSRWAPLSDIDAFRGTAHAAVTSAVSEPVNSLVTLPVFGVWTDVSSAASPALADTAAAMPSEISFTPGYLLTDGWFAEWNGRLPGLVQRVGALQSEGGRFTLAIQGLDQNGNWVAGARIWDGSLGIRRGDLAVVTCNDSAGQPATFEARVADLELPDDLKQPPPAAPLFPGGALVLDGDGSGVCGEAPGDPRVVLFDIRAGGLVLSGTRFGYAGRPVLSLDPAAAATDTFEIRWQPEEPLLAASQADPSASPAAADAVRQAQETLAVVRKARRQFYPHDAPCGPPGDLTACSLSVLFPDGHDPLAPGPALRLRVGVRCGDGAPGCDLSPAALDAHRLEANALTVEMGVTFTTISGQNPTVRRSALAVSLPTALTSVDRSQYASTPTLGTEVYASFLDDEIVNFSAGASTLTSTH